MSDDNEIIMAVCSDIAGQVRGKGFPARELPQRSKRGVGWTPTNVQITCFDVIADSPFGALDDLLLVPDPDTRFEVKNASGDIIEDAMLGKIVKLNGDPWHCCTRHILNKAIERLASVANLKASVAFEHEFQLRTRANNGSAYGLTGARQQRKLGHRIFSLMAGNHLEPDTFMKEFGPDQYEVTMKPADALRAADNAVILRELVRIAAIEADNQATFTPIRDPAGVGNGVHIHVSLWDQDGAPKMYDSTTTTGLSAMGGSFAAGVTRFLRSIMAILAPSDVSYLRLTPHRWSAAWNNLGLKDREASVRICPTTALNTDDIARQFNIEIRAADAAASPHLQLAAILFAGAEGIAQKLATPDATQEDLSTLNDAEIAARGFQRLPATLSDALDLFAANRTVRGWFGTEFCDVYTQHKRGEIDCLNGLTDQQKCERYALVY